MNFQKMNLAQLKIEAARLTRESDPALKNIRPDAAKELKVVEQLIIEKTAAVQQKIAAAKQGSTKPAAKPAPAVKVSGYLFVAVGKDVFRVTLGSKPDTTKIRKLRNHKANEIADVVKNSAKLAGGKVKAVKVTKQMLFTPALSDKLADAANKLVGKNGSLVA